jgi:hypothetical protein
MLQLTAEAPGRIVWREVAQPLLRSDWGPS